ncbi:MAG: DUF4233 domain-containing protein [Janthinobacterium lividum]
MRNPKRMMAASTLISEALLVFFATLTALALDRERQTTYLVAGGIVFLLCVLCAGMLRRRSGYVVGWVLQLVIIASGFVVPMMFGIGVVFAIIWFFALRIGSRIEGEQAEVARRMADTSS